MVRPGTLDLNLKNGNGNAAGANTANRQPTDLKINYSLMLRMKWHWFVPNLVPIWSVFLKLQAVKQSAGKS